MPLRLVRSALPLVLLAVSTLALIARPASAGDLLRDLQAEAIEFNRSPAAHWGTDSDNYTMWGTHSNRLIPVYTFGTKGAARGVDFDDYLGVHSVYRRAADIRRLYGDVPSNTHNPAADYGDQTNVYDIQKAAVAAGKKHVFLVVFDGMDWTMTRAAAIYAARKVGYASGRGTGLHFLDYTAGGTSQFGYVVTAPTNQGTIEDVDRQEVLNPGGKQPGGYNAFKGGPNPWTRGADETYLMGLVRLMEGDAPLKRVPGEHCYPDSSATASAMTTGFKTYNGAINVDNFGAPIRTIAHEVQSRGWSVGAVSSVPLSHATPACSYAHNVKRDDYQDISRDLLGLKSISHPDVPLPGLDVIVAGGFGSKKMKETAQGKNFQPGSRYVADDDLKTVDVKHGGKFVVATRTPGVTGADGLRAAVEEANRSGQRLLGFYGVGRFEGHLPYATADGDYRPVAGRRRVKKVETALLPEIPDTEVYAPEDLSENPTLAEMTEAAIAVLSRNPKGFWLMVEPGDVDWAMHDNNLDNAVGAVLSGDRAVKAITDWVEKHSNWNESLLIVTADHGHLLTITDPQRLVRGDE